MRLDGDKKWALAMFGPQGLTLDQEAVLVTMPLQRFIHVGFDKLLTEVQCDGKCGLVLGVSQSSGWFMEQRAALQTLEKELH